MPHDIFSHAEQELLSLEQKLVIQEISQGSNILVTGGAGTGKSFLLNYLKRHYSQHGLVVTASTGIAAVNIGGSTIHSWAGIGLGNMPVEQIVSNLFSGKMSKIRRRIKQTKILAIDEISMISAALFELLDHVLRAVRENSQPFGGLQMLLFGDFLQLPPITKFGETKQDFCFNSKVWNDLDLKNFNLKQIFRQHDDKFIKILNNLRFGELDEDDIKHLKSRLNANDDNLAIRPTILTSHNQKADNINQDELKKIPYEEKIFTAEFFGDQNKIDLLKKNCLALEILRLKVGAQVMMIKNTYQKEGVINGSLGVVKGFSSKKNYPMIEFSNGKTITISPEEWLIEKFDHDKKQLVTEAGMLQIPLILSWAITIHKSQGLTLDKISCDLGQIFTAGQAYVALSRARSLNSVFISSIDFKKIISDQEAAEFYHKLHCHINK